MSEYDIVVSYETMMTLAVSSIREYLRAGEERRKLQQEEIEKAKRSTK